MTLAPKTFSTGPVTSTHFRERLAAHDAAFRARDAHLAVCRNCYDDGAFASFCPEGERLEAACVGATVPAVEEVLVALEEAQIEIERVREHSNLLLERLDRDRWEY